MTKETSFGVGVTALTLDGPALLILNRSPFGIEVRDDASGAYVPVASGQPYGLQGRNATISVRSPQAGGTATVSYVGQEQAGGVTSAEVDAKIAAAGHGHWTDDLSSLTDGSRKLFKLAHAPIPGSLRVDSDASLSNASLSADAVTFDVAPPAGCGLRLQYAYQP